MIMYFVVSKGRVFSLDSYVELIELRLQALAPEKSWTQVLSNCRCYNLRIATDKNFKSDDFQYAI